MRFSMSFPEGTVYDVGLYRRMSVNLDARTLAVIIYEGEDLLQKDMIEFHFPSTEAAKEFQRKLNEAFNEAIGND